jgi:protein TonB
VEPPPAAAHAAPTEPEPAAKASQDPEGGAVEQAADSPLPTATPVESPSKTAPPAGSESHGRAEAVVDPQPGQTAPADSPAEVTAPPQPAPPATVRGALVEITEVDTAPSALEKTPPRYPAIARRMQREGTVTLRLLVDEEGQVGEVELLSGRAGDPLAKSAMRAARGWTYLPATKDGVPVRVWITERVVFKL